MPRRRRGLTKPCPGCGSEFPVRKRQLYCSMECKRRYKPNAAVLAQRRQAEAVERRRLDRTLGSVCLKCKEFKPPFEFFHSRSKVDGKVTRRSRCRTCHLQDKADYRRSRNPNYRSLQEIRSQIQSKPVSQRAIDRREWAESGLLEWANALSASFGRLRYRHEKHIASKDDPWTRKFKSVVAGMRCRVREHQLKAVPTKRLDKISTPVTWEVCLDNSLRRIRYLCKERRRRKHDRWYAKFSSTSRNWRRKTGDGRRQRPTLTPRKAATQMRFEWA